MENDHSRCREDWEEFHKRQQKIFKDGKHHPSREKCEEIERAFLKKLNRLWPQYSVVEIAVSVCLSEEYYYLHASMAIDDIVCKKLKK